MCDVATLVQRRVLNYVKGGLVFVLGERGVVVASKPVRSEEAAILRADRGKLLLTQSLRPAHDNHGRLLLALVIRQSAL